MARTTAGIVREFIATKIDCMQLGTTPAQVMAYEVWLATQEDPACFGDITLPWDEYHELLAKKRGRLDAVCTLLQQSWSMSDVRFELTDKQRGLGKLTWALARRDGQAAAYRRTNSKRSGLGSACPVYGGFGLG